jgi:hypothetical protein
MLQEGRARAPTGTQWPSPDASLVDYVEADRVKMLQVYRIKPAVLEAVETGDGGGRITYTQLRFSNNRVCAFSRHIDEALIVKLPLARPSVSGQIPLPSSSFPKFESYQAALSSL